jgi:hypothetical protein
LVGAGRRRTGGATGEGRKAGAGARPSSSSAQSPREPRVVPSPPSRAQTGRERNPAPPSAVRDRPAVSRVRRGVGVRKDGREEPHHQAASGRSAAVVPDQQRQPAGQRRHTDELPGLRLHACSDGECVPGPAGRYGDFPPMPCGHRGRARSHGWTRTTWSATGRCLRRPRRAGRRRPAGTKGAGGFNRWPLAHAPAQPDPSACSVRTRA